MPSRKTATKRKSEAIVEDEKDLKKPKGKLILFFLKQLKEWVEQKALVPHRSIVQIVQKIVQKIIQQSLKSPYYTNFLVSEFILYVY